MTLFNYECDDVKRIIDEVSPNYPQLTTYEKEWLFFHKYHYIPGVPVELEYETVSVNPTGNVSNAIPYQYKSAILKGQTLVNLVGEKRFYTYKGTTTILEGWEFMLPYNLTKDKTYLVVFNATGTISNTNSKIYLIDNNFGNTTGNTANPSIFKNGYNKVKCVATGDNHRVLRIRTQIENYSQSFQVSDVMLIEYQDGMENWDIPYFEDTQSVQMPVLRTTGKNLFNINIFKNESDEFEFPYEKWKMQLKPNTTYIANSSFTRPNNDKTNYDSYGVILNGSEQIEQLYLYHWILNLSFVNKIFTTDDTGVIYLGVYKGDCPYNVWDMVEMQIEEGSTATSYEPYKSNILTVNEDVTLRSNGDVYDELNLLTGRLTQRIDENNEVLSQEVVKTVALTPLNKPYEGTNHYELTANIPCAAILEVPVVSSGKQTLEEINN